MQIAAEIESAGGWIGFERFMELALYSPGLGYYANASPKFGTGLQRAGGNGSGGDGSDFVTAPEMTPLFGRALARQLKEALQVTGTREIWEFGAGTGALAAQLLDALGGAVDCYHIVDLSGSLREHQWLRLSAQLQKVRWHDALPQALQGVIVGNELLDAMPVTLLNRSGGAWHERGVVCSPRANDVPAFCWQDRPTLLRPPVEIDGDGHYLTEVGAQAQAFVRTVLGSLERGAAFFIDYGFPEAEYYHAQRHMGTLMCHRAHRADTDPLADVGAKDITAHVDFTAIALAAQQAADDAGTLGYTSQARFLINAGLPDLMARASAAERAMAMRLLNEHEMGELFKVIGFYKGEPWQALGFAEGDRSNML
ncbi:MAG: SAM-dependent methyltransferase, MidA [Burkholderiaceae bacterium]|nr:MAG: SAM-dependent methyltransferase, MidA [Burkholderiaceae bacterium]